MSEPIIVAGRECHLLHGVRGYSLWTIDNGEVWGNDGKWHKLRALHEVQFWPTEAAAREFARQAAGGGGIAKLVAALQAQLRGAGHTIKFLHDCLKHPNSHSYDYPEQTKRVLGDIRAVAPPVKSCHHSRTVDGCSGCASGNRERELFAWIKTKEARQLLESVEHPLPATRSQPGKGDADGWLPIDSAPKDGTRVLLCHRGMNNIGIVLEGYYCEDEGWYESNTHPTDVTDGQCFPSHWMKLPTPPTQEPEHA